MKILILILITVSIFACSNEQEIVEVTKIFSMEDVASAGFKVKKDFDTEFPDATDAKFGFYKGRDVGVIRYETLELAKSSGHASATEQTELIEVVEKNIAYGPKVERTKCRGTAQNKPDSSDVYRQYPRGIIGKENILILNKYRFFEDTEIPTKRPSHEPCVRREPMYTEFKIHGNLVILMEPLATEDQNDTIKFLNNAASNIK
tara:strand:- start:2145 stop:2756 length:612 start_codon:yes stop_codon:yes gene_type:complete